MAKSYKRISPVEAGLNIAKGKVSETDSNPGALIQKVVPDDSLEVSISSNKLQFSLPASGANAGTYNTADITVNEKGIITAVSIGTGNSMSGDAGGDLDGTYPNPKVVALTDGVELTRYPIGAITDGQFLKNSSGDIVGQTPATLASTTIYNVPQVRSGCVRYEAPRAADTTSIKASALPANGVITLAGQPDYPRKLVVTVVSAAATNDILTGTLYIEGYGPSGEDVADIFDLNVGAGTTATLISSNAYATVTKGTVSDLTFGAGGGAGSTLSVGVGNALGLPCEKPSMTKDSRSFTQKLIIPAYFDPGDAGANDANWDKMAANPSSVGIVIFNPDSGVTNGPGTGADELQYRSKLQACHNAGIKVVGYVYTSYGTRPINDVLADISTYYSLYAVSGTPYIDGIFFDEVYSIPSKEIDPANWTTYYNYYKAIYDHIHTTLGRTNDLVVLNPGSSIDHSALDVCDVICGLEQTKAVYDGWRPPAWQKDCPTSKSALIIHTTNYADLQAVVKRTKVENHGYIFVTNDTATWSTLPTDPYWTDLKNYIADTTVQIKGSLTPCYRFYNYDDKIVFEWQYTFSNPVIDYQAVWMHIFLDTDNDPGTGKVIDTNFLPSTRVGADYQIYAYHTVAGATDPTLSAPALYKWNGGGWDYIGGTTVEYDVRDRNVYRLTITRSSFTPAVTGTIKAVCQIEDAMTGATVYNGLKHSSVATIPGASASSTSISLMAVHKANVNNAHEATGTLDVISGTITPTTLPNGSNTYQFWYTYAITPVQNSHQHT